MLQSLLQSSSHTRRSDWGHPLVAVRAMYISTTPSLVTSRHTDSNRPLHSKTDLVSRLVNHRARPAKTRCRLSTSLYHLSSLFVSGPSVHTFQLHSRRCYCISTSEHYCITLCVLETKSFRHLDRRRPSPAFYSLLRKACFILWMFTRLGVIHTFQIISVFSLWLLHFFKPAF